MRSTSSNSRQFLSICLIFASTLVAVLIPEKSQAVEAYESPPLTWRENSFAASLTGEYFTSNTNYDVNRGSTVNLPSNYNFANFTSHLRGRYALSGTFSGFASGGWSRTALTDLSGDRTANSLTDLSLGLDYVAWRRWVKLVIEAQGGYPIDSVNTTQTVPLTSDGVPFGRIGVFAFKPMRYFRLTGFTGFQYMLSGLASRFLYQANVEVPFRSFVVGAGIDGYEAVTSDSNGYSSRVLTQSLAEATSNHFYAFEPGLLEARGWIGYAPSRGLQLRVGYVKTLNGVRTAAGQSILFALAYNGQDLFGPSVQTLEDEASPPIQDDEGFRTHQEKSDRTLFQDRPTQQRPRARRPVRRANPPGDSLDQTEQILEQRK